MPTSPTSRCRCGLPATNAGRCANHQPKPWANPSQNAQQLTRQDRDRIRTAQLAREPRCRACGTTQHLEADHIIPIAEGGAHDDPANLQTLCRNCHRIKTQAEAARGRARHRPTNR